MSAMTRYAAPGGGVLEGADLDVALRMPRGAVERRKGRLRFVMGNELLDAAVARVNAGGRDVR
jgi:hypothetical protein